jgi:hypothetical protein
LELPHYLWHTAADQQLYTRTLVVSVAGDRLGDRIAVSLSERLLSHHAAGRERRAKKRASRYAVTLLVGLIPYLFLHLQVDIS